MKFRFSPRATHQPLEDVADFADITAVDAYLSGKRGSGIAPAWSDLNLIDLPAHLIPRVCVVDVHIDPLDFRYRFWGTKITDMHRRDFTGESVGTVPPKVYGDILMQQYAEVYRDAVPQASLIAFIDEHHQQSTYAVKRSPLSSDGQTVDMILSIEQYDDDHRDLQELLAKVAEVYLEG